jgi:hypothetical protein
MSYGTDTADRFREAGIYSGKIIEGTKPADRRRRCGGHVAALERDAPITMGSALPIAAS